MTLEEFVTEHKGKWLSKTSERVVSLRHGIDVTKDQFESTARKMGYINGYLWGKEYPTNGKRPDLAAGTLVEAKYKDGAWHQDGEDDVDDFHWKAFSHFRITDQRYKPEPEPEPAKPWFEAGELPAIGTVVELAEQTEFLSLASGEITKIAKGAHCHVVGHAKRQDNGNMCVTLMSVINVGAGFCTGNAELLIKPIRTEREKAIDAAVAASIDTVGMRFHFGRLYDAGLLRLPEQK